MEIRQVNDKLKNYQSQPMNRAFHHNTGRKIHI